MASFDTALIDKIEYGNPTIEDYRLMKTSNYLDNLIPELQRYSPPSNSSSATRRELESLIEYSKLVEKNGRKNVFDASLVVYIVDLYKRNGYDEVEVSKIIDGILADVHPLVTKLKYHFQRPRPAQLARYYRFSLYPNFSYFQSSPSYPSGHATLAAIICEVLGNKYPASYQQMQDFSTEVRESRLYLGVHYPSDNDFAMKITERVLENPQFKKKNGL